MSKDEVKIKLKKTENGFEIPSNVNLEDLGIFDGDNFMLDLNDETGEGRLLKFTDAFLDEIEKYDEQLMNLIMDESISIPEKIKTSKIHESGAYLLGFLASINSLKSSIYELCKSRDLYSLNVLYRSFLEHYIKVYYFYNRLVVEKDDEVGVEYKKFYSKVEIAMYGKSLEHIRKMADSEFKGEDPFDILRELFPELKDFTTKQLREQVTKFNYKNMVKYIFDHQKNSNIDFDLGIILSIIPEYSELSSFVHGGPSAIISTATLYNNNNVELECCKIARSTYRLHYLSNIIFLMTIIGFVDKSYSSLFNKINKVWEEGIPKVEEVFEKFNKTP